MLISRQLKKLTAGPDWFNLPQTQLTPKLKRDLQLLQSRSILDEKRHYKKDTTKTRAPDYCQVGKIVEDATEFYSARLKRKDRKETFTGDVLAMENSTGRFKKKYWELQQKKTNGRKARKSSSLYLLLHVV